jgi:hypothetical protein
MNNKTQESILEVSKKLFAQYGFNETTTLMIADIVGIKKPSLYYFFKNKETIYITLLKKTITEVCNIFIHKKSKDLLWTMTEMFKISKKSGAFIFSVQSLSKESVKQIYPIALEFQKNMKIYFTSHTLNCSAQEAIMLVIDTSQSYARHVAENQKVVKPKKYAELIVRLIQK